MSTFQRMCMFAEQSYVRWPLQHYEEALTGIAKDVRLHVHKINDLAWCEIDDEQHWKRAVEAIHPVIEARDRVPRAVARNILLNPGPATTSDTVKYAQIVPDICPREQEFGDVMIYIADELTRLAADPKAYTTVLFGGSGTAAVESILSSVTGKEDVMIINNGAYGERMCRIADIYGLNYRVFVSPVDEPIDPEALEAFIRSGGHSPESATQTLPNPSHLAIVHCETTTGLLNDIEEVGKLCAKYGTRMIVDAVSSFAAVPIDMNRMNISYLAASANKNLQGMAGVSFVIAHQDHLESTRSLPPRNLYLHLYDQYQHFQRTGQMRFTPPVQTLYALKQAIIETKREGISNRYVRYTRSWRTLIEGLHRLGLKHLVSEEHHSKLITSIVEPSNKHYRFNDMHDFFYKRNYTIYPGKLDRLNTFRVANIGDLTYIDLEQFLAIFEQYLNGLGR
jgi:2-aminoethylphosphonate-pyruvate transaminase